MAPALKPKALTPAVASTLMTGLLEITPTAIPSLSHTTTRGVSRIARIRASSKSDASRLSTASRFRAESKMFLTRIMSIVPHLSFIRGSPLRSDAAERDWIDPLSEGEIARQHSVRKLQCPLDRLESRFFAQGVKGRVQFHVTQVRRMASRSKPRDGSGSDRSGLMIGRSDPRLLFVKHRDALGLLTLRCRPFGFHGQRLAVLGNRTADCAYGLASLLQRERGRVAVDLPR